MRPALPVVASLLALGAACHRDAGAPRSGVTPPVAVPAAARSGVELTLRTSGNVAADGAVIETRLRALTAAGRLPEARVSTDDRDGTLTIHVAAPPSCADEALERLEEDVRRIATTGGALAFHAQADGAAGWLVEEVERVYGPDVTASQEGAAGERIEVPEPLDAVRARLGALRVPEGVVVLAERALRSDGPPGGRNGGAGETTVLRALNARPAITGAEIAQVLTRT